MWMGVSRHYSHFTLCVSCLHLITIGIVRVQCLLLWFRDPRSLGRSVRCPNLTLRSVQTAIRVREKDDVLLSWANVVDLPLTGERSRPRRKKGSEPVQTPLRPSGVCPTDPYGTHLRVPRSLKGFWWSVPPPSGSGSRKTGVTHVWEMKTGVPDIRG